MKVLIVDDNEAERFIINRILTKLGVPQSDIIQSHNGEEGLNSINNKDPYVVLLDINMPKLSGLELLEMVRREKTNPPPFIIMLTTSQRDEDLKLAIEKGADAFSIKPNEPSKMKDVLRAIKIKFIDKQSLELELKDIFQYIKD